MELPVMPPVKPMLAKARATIPSGMCYEPKWDGFRAIIFRDGDQVEIGSRKERPLTRYFPELVAAVRENFPDRAVIDGEIVIIDPNRDGLDFEALQQRIHPATSRITMLSETIPAGFVAFDLLALGARDLLDEPFRVRREQLVQCLNRARPPIWVTPATDDQQLAAAWFEQFEGAGLDGLIAKDPEGRYLPDKRVMSKIKHERTADCVVAGYRAYKGDPEAIGSLLLGLWDEAGALSNIGVIGAFPMARRRELYAELQPLVTDLEDHPWSWAADDVGTDSGSRSPRKSEASRWNAGKDLSFIPLEPDLVVEARYDYLEGRRFRHTAQFVRWRPDRDPTSCTFAQLEVPTSFELAAILPASPTP